MLLWCPTHLNSFILLSAVSICLFIDHSCINILFHQPKRHLPYRVRGVYNARIEQTENGKVYIFQEWKFICGKCFPIQQRPKGITTKPLRRPHSYKWTHGLKMNPYTRVHLRTWRMLSYYVNTLASSKRWQLVKGNVPYCFCSVFGAHGTIPLCLYSIFDSSVCSRENSYSHRSKDCYSLCGKSRYNYRRTSYCSLSILTRAHKKGGLLSGPVMTGKGVTVLN